MVSGTRYYIEDYSDEIVPCDCTLEGWAAWLAKPEEGWGRDEAAADGDRFKAYVTSFGDDIVLSTDADGKPVLSYRPERANFFALRWGAGLGWDADNIIGDSLDMLEDWLTENPDDWSDDDRIAVGFDEPEVMLVYHADGPRMTVEALQ